MKIKTQHSLFIWEAVLSLFDLFTHFILYIEMKNFRNRVYFIHFCKTKCDILKQGAVHDIAVLKCHFRSPFAS